MQSTETTLDIMENRSLTAASNWPITFIFELELTVKVFTIYKRTDMSLKLKASTV